MKLFDWIAVFAVLVIGIVGIAVNLTREVGAQVEIVTPDSRYLYPLTEDREITVQGELGDYLIEISNGKVRAVESVCGAQICVMRGWISRSGDSIVCVPNRIMITITEQDQDLDAIIE